MNDLLKHEYPAYYQPYIQLVPKGDIETILQNQVEETIDLLSNLTEEQLLFKYKDDKWTIKETIGHITDTERIMAYRMLSIARGETAALPGYDDRLYVSNGDFNRVNTTDLLEHLQISRKATIQFMKLLPKEAWERIGNANGTNVSVRALAYIIAGHERHHRNLIRERYILSPNFPK